MGGNPRNSHRKYMPSTIGKPDNWRVIENQRKMAMPDQQYGGMMQQQQNNGFGAQQNFSYGGQNNNFGNGNFGNGNFGNGNFGNQQGFGNNF